MQPRCEGRSGDADGDGEELTSEEYKAIIKELNKRDHGRK